MRRYLAVPAILFVVAACTSSSDGAGPFAPTTAQYTKGIRDRTGEKIPGEYVIRFADSVTDSPALAGMLAKRYGGQPFAIWRHALKGMAIRLPDSLATRLAADPRIVSIEPNRVVTIAGTQTGAPWGLDRLDQWSLPLDGSYTWNYYDGTGVTAYIIDSGILLGHAEFGGRAVTGTDQVTAGGTATDCSGHGSHVAGTVGGTTYGVAKNVKLVAVRVLNCADSGKTSDVIAGVDWVTAQKQANPAVPSVANMSLGGGLSAALNSAVANAVAAGVVMVVAAGNSAADACSYSPAAAPSAITVGATDNTDTFAWFSNYGPCVDINAPGVAITSAWYTSTTATNTISGTSMAAPHVAGAVALYLQQNPSATPAQVASAFTNGANTGVITGLPAGTVNKLLRTGFIAPPTPHLEGPVDVLASSNCRLTYIVRNGTRISDWITDGTVVAVDADWIQLTFPTPRPYHVETTIVGMDGVEVVVSLDPVASASGIDCT